MRKIALAAAGLLAAAIFFVLVALPAAPIRSSLDHIDPALRGRTVSGAYHVHSTRSDGGKDKASIAQAAAAAGLQFVIFTDHGDGTRPPDAPQYLHNVLCLDGVEISTDGGHYVALGLGPTPYPLGGAPAAVVEDVSRFGGFGIAAHPDHPKASLAWTDWMSPIDGIEWLNADSEWRDEGGVAVARLALAYLLRPSAAMASTFDRPSRTLDRWDELSRRRRVVALAAVDAHGKGSGRNAEEGETRVGIGPSYEASFGAVTNRVLLERPWSKDAAQDAQLLLAAIRRGDVYSVVDAISPDVVLNLGSRSLAWTSSADVPSTVEPFTDGERQRLEVNAERAPGTPPVPWIVTNWVGPYPSTEMASVRPLPDAVPLSVSSAWRVEHDPESSGRVSAGASVVTLEYRLAGGDRRSQFTAAVVDLDGRSRFGALTFRGRADAPMRISVQLRFRPDDRRWVKSVYLGPEDRDISIRMSDMRAAEPGEAPMPPLSSVRSLLFVADLVNAPPGRSGTFTISDLRATSEGSR